MPDVCALQLLLPKRPGWVGHRISVWICTISWTVDRLEVESGVGKDLRRMICLRALFRLNGVMLEGRKK